MWITVRMVGHYCNAHDSPFLNQPIDMVGVVSAQFPFRSGCTHRIPWFTMQTPKKLRPQKKSETSLREQISHDFQVPLKRYKNDSETTKIRQILRASPTTGTGPVSFTYGGSASAPPTVGRAVAAIQVPKVTKISSQNGRKLIGNMLVQFPCYWFIMVFIGISWHFWLEWCTMICISLSLD